MKGLEYPVPSENFQHYMDTDLNYFSYQDFLSCR